MYSHQNSITVKEELAQLIDMFRMLVEIHEEQEEIDKEYDDEIWFDDLDQKILSFKHKVHNWLKEGEKLRKSNQVSRCSSKSSSRYSSKSSAKSNSSTKSRSSTKAKAIEEKVKVAELMTEIFFRKKKNSRSTLNRTTRLYRTKNIMYCVLFFFCFCCFLILFLFFLFDYLLVFVVIICLLSCFVLCLLFRIFY